MIGGGNGDDSIGTSSSHDDIDTNGRHYAANTFKCIFLK